MVAKKRRDSGYWRTRLERDHPAVYTKLLSGEIKSVRAACVAAGLIHLPTRLDALKREWSRATPDQRRAFLGWLKAGAPPSLAPADLVASDGHLKPTVIRRVEQLMRIEGMTVGQVAARLGYNKLNPRLGLALNRRSKPGAELLERLAKLLRASK